MSQSAGEKTEQPTSKRLKDARKKGQVAKSQDLSGALLLLASVGVLWLIGGKLAGFAVESLKEQFIEAASFTAPLTQEVVFGAMYSGVMSLAALLAPLFLVIWVLAFFINYLQVGSVFSAESIKPNFNKLNPAEGFKNKFFKMRPYVELAKTLLKMMIAALVAGSVFWAAKLQIVQLMNHSIDVAVVFAFGLFVEIGFKTGLAFLTLGALDYFLQVYMHRRDLRMTKHEVREEYKETEGNPLIKSQRRALHRDLLKEGMAAAVRTADVVIANPTHIAVAIEYEKGSDAAPRIVAKGADLMAAQIRKIARESDVPITRDISLARTLYELEVDEEIPEELYEAVAVVLRWVYGANQAQTGQKVSMGAHNG